jgi:ribosome maturation factor RimP
VKVNRNEGSVDIFIDCSGGLGIEECTAIHRSFMKELSDDATLDDYTISFSTPGLGRKCVYPQDFLFYPEKVFELRLKNGEVLTGLVSVTDADTGKLSIRSADESVIEINWMDVKRAGFRLDF